MHYQIRVTIVGFGRIMAHLLWLFLVPAFVLSMFYTMNTINEFSRPKPSPAKQYVYQAELVTGRDLQILAAAERIPPLPERSDALHEIVDNALSEKNYDLAIRAAELIPYRMKKTEQLQRILKIMDQMPSDAK